MVLYIRYTLYFIAYTSPSPPASYFASYATTNFVLTFPLRCTTRLHAERARRSFLRESADIMPLAYSLCFRPGLASFDSNTLGSPFHAFSPFFSLTLPPPPNCDHLRPSLPLPLVPLPFPFFLSRHRPRAFVGETFFRSITFIGWSPFIRAPGPRYYPLINCSEKKYIK